VIISLASHICLKAIALTNTIAQILAIKANKSAGTTPVSFTVFHIKFAKKSPTANITIPNVMWRTNTVSCDIRSDNSSNPSMPHASITAKNIITTRIRYPTMDDGDFPPSVGSFLKPI